MSSFTGKEASDMFLYYLKLIKEESDRGAIILAATILSEGLAKALKSRRVKKIPANFSLRIKCAYELGLIKSDVRDMLTLIRVIRNDCAHSIPIQLFEADQDHSKIISLFMATPEIYTAFQSEVTSFATESKVDIASDNFIELLGIRNIFNLLFACHAMAINRLYLEAENYDA